MKPKLRIIVAGAPGTGKTTAAALIRRIFSPFRVVRVDDKPPNMNGLTLDEAERLDHAQLSSIFTNESIELEIQDETSLAFSGRTYTVTNTGGELIVEFWGRGYCAQRISYGKQYTGDLLALIDHVDGWLKRGVFPLSRDPIGGKPKDG